MSDIVKYEKEPLPVKSVAEMQAIGELFEMSGSFGCKEKGQGIVVAMTCIQEKMSPLEFLQTYHIIDGKPTMRADAMLARLEEKGGTYEILTRTSEQASICVSYKERKETFHLTWEDVQREPFVRDKKKEFKTNWATPRARMQSLWARVVSDGVRTVCPKANRGSYAPEEIQDLSDMPAVNSGSASRKRKVTVPDPIETTCVETPSTTVEETPKPDQATGKAFTDPEAMPIGKHAGKKWIEFPTSALAQAVGINDDRITDAHKAAIRIVLEQRKAAELDAEKKTEEAKKKTEKSKGAKKS